MIHDSCLTLTTIRCDHFRMKFQIYLVLNAIVIVVLVLVDSHYSYLDVNRLFDLTEETFESYVAIRLFFLFIFRIAIIVLSFISPLVFFLRGYEIHKKS